MPTKNTFLLVVFAFAVVALILWRIADSFYEQWRGDNLESTIVGFIAVFTFTISGAFAGLAVLRKKYPAWDGRTLTKNATSKADRDTTRMKIILVLFAFGVLATLLWLLCLAVYANNFVGDTTNARVIIAFIAWLAALPAANYMAYRAAMAVLRRKYPTWNGKILRYQRNQQSHASVE